jgi:hypothetical protein
MPEEPDVSPEEIEILDRVWLKIIEAKKMKRAESKGMDHNRLLSLFDFIVKNHSWHNGIQSHAIKYIRPHFDTRTGDFFGVSFDGLRGRIDFFIVNENRHRDLYEWVVEFLNSDPDKPLYPWKDEGNVLPARPEVE